MKRVALLLALFGVLTGGLFAQQAGLMLGIDYNTASLQNPYVSFGGTIQNPTGLQEFSDSTDFVFMPFGFSAFLEDGYIEVTTYTFHLLVQYFARLLAGDSTYDQYFRNQRDSILISRLNNDEDMRFFDRDFLRFAASGRILESLPILAGAQGAIANVGINTPGTGSTGEGPGTLAFDDEAVLYGGVNAGASFNLAGVFLQGIAYYDWYYLMDPESGGTVFSVDVHLLPFYEQGAAGGFFVRGRYRRGEFEFYQQFADQLPVIYSFDRFTFGVGYVLGFEL